MKKGQITVFLMIAIILLLAIGLLFYVTAPKKISPAGTTAIQEKISIEQNINGCLEQAAKEAYRQSGLDTAKLEESVNNDIPNCVDFDSYRKQGLKIEPGKTNTKIQVSDNAILFSLHYPIKLAKDKNEIAIENFNFYLDRLSKTRLAYQEGVLSGETHIVSSNGRAELVIEKGTAVYDENGNLADEISINLDAYYDNNYVLLRPSIYDMAPNGAIFSKPAKLIIRYEGYDVTPAQEPKLQIVWIDESKGLMLTVPSAIDIQKKTVTGEINHFTKFGISIECTSNAIEKDVYFDTSYIYISNCEPCNALKVSGAVYDPIELPSYYGTFEYKNDKLKIITGAKKIEKYGLRGGTEKYNDADGCHVDDWDKDDQSENENECGDCNQNQKADCNSKCKQQAKEMLSKKLEISTEPKKPFYINKDGIDDKKKGTCQRHCESDPTPPYNMNCETNTVDGCSLNADDLATPNTYGYESLDAVGGEGAFEFNLTEGSCISSVNLSKTLIDDAVESIQLNGNELIRKAKVKAPDGNQLLYGEGYDKLNDGGSISEALKKINNLEGDKKDKGLKQFVNKGTNTIKVKVKNIAQGCSNARFMLKLVGNGAVCKNEGEVGKCCDSGNPIEDCEFSSTKTNFQKKIFNYPNNCENKFGADYYIGEPKSHLNLLKGMAGECGWVKGFATDIGSLKNADWTADFIKSSKEMGLNPVIRVGGSLGDNKWSIPTSQQILDFVKAVEAKGQKIEFIEILNEPNINGEFAGKADPAGYAQLLYDSANKLHQYSPDIKIISAGLSPGVRPGREDTSGIKREIFIPEMFKSKPELTKVIDIWGSHSYQTTEYREELKLLKQYYKDEELPLVLITETGLPNDDGSKLAEGYKSIWLGDKAVIAAIPFAFGHPSFRAYNFIDEKNNPNVKYKTIKDFREKIEKTKEGSYPENVALPSPTIAQPSPQQPKPETKPCPYKSAQARVQKNTNEPWSSNLNIDIDDSFRVGAFYGETGRFADGNLKITGTDFEKEAKNGETLELKRSGNYVLTATTCAGSDIASIKINPKSVATSANTGIETSTLKIKLQDYDTVTFKNNQMSVSFIPLLGGRIYELNYNNRNQLYKNMVYKEVEEWAFKRCNHPKQGWPAFGGIEFSFPEQEHGCVFDEPFGYYVTKNKDNSATITMFKNPDSNTKDLKLTIKATVYPDKPYLKLDTKIENPTKDAVKFQYWSNAMLSPGGKDPANSDMEIIYPANQIKIHSSGIAGFEKGKILNWPIINGKDFTKYSNWQSYLGFFAVEPKEDYVAVYSKSEGEGIIRIFDKTKLTGIKLFSPKEIPKSKYTEENGNSYFEIQGGLTKDYDEEKTISAGSSLEMTEYWYPVKGLNKEMLSDEIKRVVSEFKSGLK